jgi:hypothetical protein
MEIVLWLVSVCLRDALAPFQFLHTIVNAVRWKGKWRYIKDTAFEMALANDVYGGMAYQNVLNAWFIKKGGYHYGKKGETISSATGKGWVLRLLAFLGMCLCGALNFIDVATRKHGGHCFVFIERDGEEYPTTPPSPVKWYYTAVGLIGVALAGIIGLAWRVMATYWVIVGLWGLLFN